MSKIIILFVTSLLLLTVGWFTINQEVTAQQQKDRYQTECGILLLESPEDYLAGVSRYWNYNFDDMPESLHKQYECVNWVNIQDNAGVVSSRSHWDGHN